MPPISRSDFPYPLRTVDGTVDLQVDEITTGTLTVTGDTNLNNLNVAGNTVLNDTIINNLTQLNGQSFFYGKGYFTPNLKCLAKTGTGVLELQNWAGTPTINYREGFYERVGNLVNLWYNVQLDNVSGFENDFLFTPKFPVITDLPFAAKISFLNHNQSTSWAVSNPSFPNGYAFGIGAPATILMPYPLTATVLTKDFPFVPDVPPAYITNLSWIADGKTIVFSGDQLQQVLGTIFWESPGHLYNFNILSTGTYSLRFSGMVSYFCED
jgi:hypothetical protein